IFKAGKPFDIQPIGLGARDTLRLEMKYCLYGNDIDKTKNPLEAGLGWITKFDKGDFIGRETLLKIKETGVARRLIAFEMVDRGIPRHGYKMFADGDEIGTVTSGTQSPSLNKGIGLGYVAKEHSKIGTELEIESRGRLLKAKIVKPPFVHSKTS
ncbi:MAG: glycine cleavage system aminomethyltransferase GcvT, partial [Candidatus Marinimicrobia bacterium]|nr:glycine cleavage system aminomethyltransferase GcvT [Candidatus Neomarinimicrobiota bacterium]